MIKISALLFGMLTGCAALAQSLGDAYQQAWSRSPQALALPALDTQAQAQAEAAAGVTAGAPSVSLSNLNDKSGKNRGKQEWEIELAMPLWLPGQQAARQAEAGSAQQAVAARRVALRLQVAGEMREVWWALAAARNDQRLAQYRLDTARALEQQVLRRYRVGELARTDSNLAQHERLAAEAELAEADLLLRQAEQSYHQLTGAQAPAQLPAETIQPALRETSEHPQLRAVAAHAQLARAKLKTSEESRRDAPELALRVVRERADFSEAYSHAIGIKLTIPFSSGPRLRQENAAARAELAQADAELALSRMKLELEQGRAGLDLDASARQLSLAQQRQALSADNLTLAEKSFALGETDLTGLLRVRAAALEAQALLSRQQLKLATAQSRFNQIFGVLP